MNKEKIKISVNEEDVQNIINCYEKDIEYIKQLEQENQQLKEEIKGYQQMYFDKVMIINKAIEMLEKYPITSKLDSDYILVNDLLEILKGEN